MSPGTDTSIQKNKMASAQWPNGAGQAPSRHSRGNSSRSPHRIQPSRPGPGPLAKIFQRSVQFVNCRQRAPIGTPVRKEGQARTREIALEPAEILSTRRLRLVANWQQTLVLAPSFPPSGDAAGIHSLVQHLTAHSLNSEARRRCPPTFLFAPPCLRWAVRADHAIPDPTGHWPSPPP